MRFFLLLFLLQTAAAQPARNILFIMGDDHAAYALGAYGSPVARTPHLDRLAAAGVRFDRAYVNSPICNASRQAILTSRLPHTLRVNQLFTPLDVAEVTIADHLKAQGFATAAIGKMHFNSFKETLRAWGLPEALAERADEHHGFDVRIDRAEYRRSLEARPPRRAPKDALVMPAGARFDDLDLQWNAAGLPDSVYDESSEARFFADEAIGFLRAHREDRFCLWLSFREPHAPFAFPLEDAGSFDPSDMTLPAVSAEDEPWIPAVFREATPAQRRGIAASYYTSIQHLDRNIGRVLGALEALDLSAQTLVVYVGDHGYLLGHHGRFEKHTMWEEAVRAPLLMRGPGLGEGRTVSALVEFIDLAPTMLDLLGVGPMETAQGRSFAPLLEGRVDRHRHAVFSEYLIDDLAMVRTDRWKYVFTAGRRDLQIGYATGRGAPGPVHRLYDLWQDPGEQHSLAGDPAYRSLLAWMQRLMLERFEATHPEGQALPGGLSAEGKLSWFTRSLDPPAPGAPVH